MSSLTNITRLSTAGWQANIAHTGYLPLGTVKSKITYRRGIGGLGAIPAPEEQFNEGTSHSQIVTADIAWNKPFTIGNSNLNWRSRLNGQWTNDKLVQKDIFSAGGRSSVRGVIGVQSIALEMKTTVYQYY